jgi:DNA replication regulator SLD3
MRSASSTFIPGLKREGSEPLMASIPKGGLGQTARKGTLARSESQSSLASTEDVKARKKALVEAELHDAISALKKPNRALAGKSIVDFAEKRSSAGISQLKKAKKPIRLAPSGVQIKATPANQRFKDVLAGEKQSGSMLSVLRESEDIVPSSSSVIPSTAARRGPQKVFSTSPAFVSTPPTAKGQATPAELAQDDVPVLKLSRPAALIATPSGRKVQSTLARMPSGPLLAVPGRSSGRDKAMLPPSSPGFGRLLEDTPMKPRPSVPGRTLRTVEAATPAAPVIASIYEQLGWDDDGDLDDLA